MKAFIVLIAVFLAWTRPIYAQFPLTSEHWNGFFGTIQPSPNEGTEAPPFGSAFVFGPNKQIITCAHVVIDGWSHGYTNLTYGAQGIGKRELHLIIVLPRVDLAIFSCTNEIPGKPLDFGDFRRIRPGDVVYYAGFDVRESTSNLFTCKMSPAQVTAIGSQLSEGTRF
jgi:hypothetical protein